MYLILLFLFIGLSWLTNKPKKNEIDELEYELLLLRQLRHNYLLSIIKNENEMEHYDHLKNQIKKIKKLL